MRYSIHPTQTQVSKGSPVEPDVPGGCRRTERRTGLSQPAPRGQPRAEALSSLVLCFYRPGQKANFRTWFLNSFSHNYFNYCSLLPPKITWLGFYIHILITKIINPYLIAEFKLYCSFLPSIIFIGLFSGWLLMYYCIYI